MKKRGKVECGRIGRALGLKGENIVFWGGGGCPVDAGGELEVFEKSGGGGVKRKVAALRCQGRFHVVRFEGFSTRNESERLKGARLFVAEEDLKPLSLGEYYCHQLIDIVVVTEDARPIGKVKRIFSAGGADVYEVESHEGGKRREILIPAISDVVLNIDLEKNTMTVRLLEEI